MIVLYILGALLLIGIIMNDAVYSILSGFMFEKEGQFAEIKQQYGAQANQIITQLKQLRFDLFWKDFVKFSIIAGASLGLIVLFVRKKVRTTGLAVGLIIILIIDLAIVDVKYINPKPGTAITEHFQADRTIRALQAESQKDLFRVLPLPVNDLDNENMLMYNGIQSVDGYSPAKIKIYQEVRDSCIYRGNRNVFNMLNVKYFMGREQSKEGSSELVLQQNPGYLPRAWFVDTVVIENSKHGVFARLNDPRWNPGTTAILEKGLAAQVMRPESSTVDISVASYSSRSISVRTTNTTQSLLVLSEVYYPAGWKAFVDGNETEIYKTNYILRSVIVPPGEHVVEFHFDSPSYVKGYTISQIGWGLTVILIFIGVFQLPAVKKKIGRKKIGKIDGTP